MRCILTASWAVSQSSRLQEQEIVQSLRKRQLTDDFGQIAAAELPSNGAPTQLTQRATFRQVRPELVEDPLTAGERWQQPQPVDGGRVEPSRGAEQHYEGRVAVGARRRQNGVADRRPAVEVGRVRGGVVLEQDIDASGARTLASPRQWRRLIEIDRVDVGPSVLEQGENALRRAAKRGPVEGSVAASVAGVDVGAGGQQDFHAGRFVALGGIV